VQLILLCLSIIMFPVVIASYYAGKRIVARREPDPPATPTQYGMDAEAVLFKSIEGLWLEGWWIPAPSPTKRTVIQCHGQNGSMDADIAEAKILHTAGLNVLMFNFRAHGNSEGDYVTFGLTEKNDVLGAIQYLADVHGIQSVGVLGFSMGALVAIRAAAESDAIACIVADGATGAIQTTIGRWIERRWLPPSFVRTFVRLSLWFGSRISEVPLHKVNGARWVREVKSAPILFIHGEDDQFVDEVTIRHLQKAASVESVLWVVPEARHREAHKRYPREYAHEIVKWFDTYLVL
jgi:alpha-beta hydrolase superfamily lysophospholipase